MVLGCVVTVGGVECDCEAWWGYGCPSCYSRVNTATHNTHTTVCCTSPSIQCAQRFTQEEVLWTEARAEQNNRDVRIFRDILRATVDLLPHCRRQRRGKVIHGKPDGRGTLFQPSSEAICETSVVLISCSAAFLVLSGTNFQGDSPETVLLIWVHSLMYVSWCTSIVRLCSTSLCINWKFAHNH